MKKFIAYVVLTLTLLALLSISQGQQPKYCPVSFPDTVRCEEKTGIDCFGLALGKYGASAMPTKFTCTDTGPHSSICKGFIVCGFPPN